MNAPKPSTLASSINTLTAPLSNIKLTPTALTGGAAASPAASSEKKPSSRAGLSVRKKTTPVAREQSASGNLPVPVGGMLGAASGNLTNWALRGTSLGG